MTRPIHRLSSAALKKAGLGMHPDGGNLYLQVTAGQDATLNKSWIFRYVFAGRERHMGLGSVANVSLAEARVKAADERKMLAGEFDPLAARNASKAAAAAANARSMTFEACADRYIAAHRAGWKNLKHAQQWQNTLKEYVAPMFGRVPVQDVDTGMVMRVLEPMWQEKTETGYRVRGRIESVLDWAKANGYRDGENPARWRGHLENLLAKRSRIRRIKKHHPALPYAELPEFFGRLRTEHAVNARALEFAILTAARTGEVVSATIDEINFNDKVWTIPADRMKADKEHRVPLCDRALAIIKELAPLRDTTRHLFPGRGSKLGDRAMLNLLEQIDRKDITPHGFRSTFRDWAAECTNFPAEVVEMALAHTIGNKVESAYRRGDLFEKRRRLMAAWAEYCERGKGSADVVLLRTGA